MKKNIFILMLSLSLLGCDLGFPRMYVNYDHLPEGEIKEHIVKTFPNDFKKEDFCSLILPHLNGNNSAENIKISVSKMGMTCESEKEVCKYDGDVRTRATGGHSGSGRAKHIYRIMISPSIGLKSLKIENKTVEDTEKDA